MARSQRFTTEVRILALHSVLAPGTRFQKVVLYWSESAPIAQRCRPVTADCVNAAWKTPKPEVPAAAKITSAPPWYISVPASPPSWKSSNPDSKFGGRDR